MNILVTDGAGSIGSHLVDKLIKDGHSVFCLNNFDTFYDPAIKHENTRIALESKAYTLIEGDIRDTRLLQECFLHKKLDNFIHLSARAGFRPSIQQPDLYYDVNIIGTLLRCH